MTGASVATSASPFLGLSVLLAVVDSELLVILAHSHRQTASATRQAYLPFSH